VDKLIATSHHEEFDENGEYNRIWHAKPRWDRYFTDLVLRGFAMIVSHSCWRRVYGSHCPRLSLDEGDMRRTSNDNKQYWTSVPGHSVVAHKRIVDHTANNVPQTAKQGIHSLVASPLWR